MTAALIVLRTIHIVGGVLWAGSAISYTLFVEPTVKTLGPAAPKFMQGFIEDRRYTLYMNIFSAATIIAGAILFWMVSGGLNMAWISSGPGLGFTLGSIVALVVYGIGFFMLRPRAERLGELGQEIGRSGGPPSAEQTAEMQKIQESMSSIGRVDAILLLISLVLMATARYWRF